MENKCVLNKKSVAKKAAIKKSQKMSRKYYEEKLFAKANNAPKAKIRKITDLDKLRYVNLTSDSYPTDVSNGLNAAINTAAKLIDMCRETNLAGRSGNGFPVWKKLEAVEGKAKLLIINGVECDPGLVTDSWIYRNRLEKVVDGAYLIKKAFDFDKVIIATKEVLNLSFDIEQIKVPDRFPMGYENYLVKHITGLELREGEHPSDKGILVMNMQTLLTIMGLVDGDAEFGANSKLITLSNLNAAKSIVVNVKLGDSISEIVKRCLACGELGDEVLANAIACKECDILVGSGAMSCHVMRENEVIDDTTCYIALGVMTDYSRASACKNCGACTKNCPQGVMVHKIVQYVDKNGMNNPKACDGFNAKACIGCGACTYGCMAGKDVRELVAFAKTGEENKK